MPVGTFIELTLCWISLKEDSAIIPLSIQTFFRKYLALPKNKLCMGSTMAIRGASKYGSLTKTEYRQPDSDSFFSSSLKLVALSKLREVRLCSVPVLGGQL